MLRTENFTKAAAEQVFFSVKKEENVTSHYKAIGLEVTHSFSIVLRTKSDNKVLLGYNHIHSNRSLSY